MDRPAWAAIVLEMDVRNPAQALATAEEFTDRQIAEYLARRRGEAYAKLNAANLRPRFLRVEVERLMLAELEKEKVSAARWKIEFLQAVNEWLATECTKH